MAVFDWCRLGRRRLFTFGDDLFAELLVLDHQVLVLVSAIAQLWVQLWVVEWELVYFELVAGCLCCRSFVVTIILLSQRCQLLSVDQVLLQHRLDNLVQICFHLAMLELCCFDLFMHLFELLNLLSHRHLEHRVRAWLQSLRVLNASWCLSISRWLDGFRFGQIWIYFGLWIASGFISAQNWQRIDTILPILLLLVQLPLEWWHVAITTRSTLLRRLLNYTCWFVLGGWLTHFTLATITAKVCNCLRKVINYLGKSRFLIMQVLVDLSERSL